MSTGGRGGTWRAEAWIPCFAAIAYDPRMLDALAADLRRAVDFTETHQTAEPSRRAVLRACFDKQETWPIIEFRLRQAALRRSPPGLRLVVRAVVWITRHVSEIVTGVYLPTTVEIGPGLALMHIGPIIVNGDFVAGDNLTIAHQTTIGGLHGGTPTAGDCVFIGPGARVLGAVHLGDRAMVGANAVVTKDVPSDHVATGIPAVARPDTHGFWMAGAERPA